MTIKQKMIFVGDNPFHGISHLSDDRARSRGNEIFDIDYATKLVISSLENGANGFMFSVSEATLSILKSVSKKIENKLTKTYKLKKRMLFFSYFGSLYFFNSTIDIYLIKANLPIFVPIPGAST